MPPHLTACTCDRDITPKLPLHHSTASSAPAKKLQTYFPVLLSLSCIADAIFMSRGPQTISRMALTASPPPTFLTLPTEIRLMIYSSVLPQIVLRPRNICTVNGPEGESCPKCREDQEARIRRPLFALSTVSKLTSTEVESVINKVPIVLELEAYDIAWERADAIPKRYRRNVHLIRLKTHHFTWLSWENSEDALFQRCPNLRNVQLELPGRYWTFIHYFPVPMLMHIGQCLRNGPDRWTALKIPKDSSGLQMMRGMIE